MKKINLLLVLSFILILISSFDKPSGSSEPLNEIMPVRGLCIGAPSPERTDEFVRFIGEALTSMHVNTLILRVDYQYEYKSHPELQGRDALSKKDLKKILKACRENGIRLIPHINLLGHQSWASRPGMLLKAYPEFDETPEVKFPEKYEWPNADGLYCKSYCPLHPEVHKVIFDIVDELCDVCESDAFHAGMDEVFYIGNDNCPRCSGSDKSELFAGEVRRIHDHLAMKGRELWIWGDRLIDGKTTGIGMWEASMNNTWRAIDMIPKDVFICDWHYERADLTPVMFAMKGFRVASCPYQKPDVGINQARNMIMFRNQSSPPMKDNFQGVIQTVWNPADDFLDEFYGRKMPKKSDKSEVICFKALFDEVGKTGIRE